jgi:hypothetical protein
LDRLWQITRAEGSAPDRLATSRKTFDDPDHCKNYQTTGKQEETDNGK